MYILLINVLILVIRLTSLLLILASPALLPAPNAGSVTVFDHPTICEAHQKIYFDRRMVGGKWYLARESDPPIRQLWRL